MKNTGLVFIMLVLPLGQVGAIPIDALDLAGGSFTWGGAGGTLTPAAYSQMAIEGGYHGSEPTSAGTEAEYATTSIATGQFDIFGPLAVYTAPTDDVGVINAPPVSGDLIGSNLTLDLRSWTVFWNGTSINHGADGVTAVVDANGDFTASWTTITSGGATDGFEASWTISGNVSAVPVPAAVWLFASGLVGLLGSAWRKR